MSYDNALENIKVEAPHWDFERYQAGARSEWEKALSKISVKGTNEDKLYVFYSALYS